MTITNSTDHFKKHGKETGVFYFKQFKVEDGRSTMKVGTDSVLLGAIAEVENTGNILEIGTGCGVIALILAQRSQSKIDAIEIDEGSARQAGENVRNSSWQDRITIIHSSLQDFILQSEKRYDLVISNPPYFSRSLKSSDKKRNISRHNDVLSFDELITGSTGVMSPGGSLWVILPVKESMDFIEKAMNYGLHLHLGMKVIPKTGKECHRVIMHLKKAPAKKVTLQTLTIRNADNSYTLEYMEVTRDLYLDF